MNYTEIKKDLFYDIEQVTNGTKPNIRYAQCISADFACGAGIALQFNKYLNIKNYLMETFTNFREEYNKYVSELRIKGTCLEMNGTYNLITKERYFHKPTLVSLRSALDAMKQQILSENNFAKVDFDYIKTIRMPKIGCGLDGLSWEDVSKLIKEIFEDTDLNIEIYYL